MLIKYMVLKLCILITYRSVHSERFSWVIIKKQQQIFDVYDALVFCSDHLGDKRSRLKYYNNKLCDIVW